MEKVCLLKQSIGIGDILFLQTAARKYLAEGFKVIWPIRKDIIWLKNYLVDKTTDNDIMFYSHDDDYPYKHIYGQDETINTPNFVFYDLASAHYNCTTERRIMAAKYAIQGFDYREWRDNFKFERLSQKEDELYYDVLGLRDDERYVFWNNLCSVDTRVSDVIPPPSFEERVVKLQYVDGFTLFDWCKVMEKATKVHVINTSINYIIDMLDTNYEEYVIYSHFPANVPEINYLFKTPHVMK